MADLKHGCNRRGRVHPLYYVWQGMKSRCFRESHDSFPQYGGRGISVCAKWKDSFSEFKKWADASGWVKGLHIDRINNDGDYCPENCRIATPAQNCLNTRRNVSLTAFGETKTIREWADDRRCVVSAKTLRSRVSVHGYDAVSAITLPSWQRRGK